MPDLARDRAVLLARDPLDELSQVLVDRDRDLLATLRHNILLRKFSQDDADPRRSSQRTALRDIMSTHSAGIGLAMNETVLDKLENRLGRLHAKQRLGIETDHEAQIFGQGINFFHIENWYSIHGVLRAALKLMGLYNRGSRNAEKIQVRHNYIESRTLPKSFDGFTLLHISDLHADISDGAMRRLIELIPGVSYDVCVLTGDYRGATYGPFDVALKSLGLVAASLQGPVYGVLGNHDTILMVPDLEEMGIKILLNESEPISRGDETIYLSGIDDAHFYRVDNIEKATLNIPDGAFSILLSHTPEIYRQAAHAGVDLLLSGHTHGGQICLPGSIPITLGSVLPRHMGSGRWNHGDMIGYTSVGVGCAVMPVRLNCFPEITLHHLKRV
jgi:predicted MPP superfamily phosphohydrolase